MDYFRGTFDFMAFGHDQWLCDRWIHTYPAGDRHCRGADQDYPRTNTLVTSLKPMEEGD